MKLIRLETKMVAQWNSSSSSLQQEGGDDDLPEPPRLPLSAYNFFFKAERARILGAKAEEQDAEEAASVEAAGGGGKKRKHRKTPGMIGFRQLANHVGERWRNLTDEEKVPYQKKFAGDRTRYKKEMKEWEDAQRRRTIRQNKIMMAQIKMQKEQSVKNKQTQVEQQQQHMFQMQRKQQHALTQDVPSMSFPSSLQMTSRLSGGDTDQFLRSSRTSAVLARAISIIHEGKGESFLAQDGDCVHSTEPGQHQWERNLNDLPDMARRSGTPRKEFYQDMKMRNMMNTTNKNRPEGDCQGFNDTLAQISRGVLMKNWGTQQQHEEDHFQEEKSNHLHSFGPSPKRRNAVANHFDVADSFCVDKEEPEPYSIEEFKLHQKFCIWQGETQRQQHLQEQRQQQQHVDVKKPFNALVAPSIRHGGNVCNMFPNPMSVAVYNQEMSASVNQLENELGHLMGDDLIQSLAGGM
jgi:hypothetical protein